MNDIVGKLKASWSTRKGKVVISIGTILFVCICCSTVSSLFSPKSQNTNLPVEDVKSTAMAMALTSVAQTQIAGATPTPSQTPIPTETPMPTATSTPLPQPISLTGSGDSIVEVSKWDGAAIMHAKYASGGNFALINYGQNNNKLDLLVNTIGAYEGTVPIDFMDGEKTTRLEVKASGPWELLISPLASAKIYDLPTVIAGIGDDVVFIRGGNADIIKADNSQGNGNFAVWAYSKSTGRDLTFNEIAPYTGTALLSPDTFLLTIKAEGNWSLDISVK
jgi:hypothetical protein